MEALDFCAAALNWLAMLLLAFFVLNVVAWYGAVVICFGAYRLIGRLLRPSPTPKH